MTKAQRMRECLIADPTRTDSDIAREIGGDDAHVRRERRKLEALGLPKTELKGRPPTGGQRTLVKPEQSAYALAESPMLLGDWMEDVERKGVHVIQVHVILTADACGSTVVDLGQMRGDDIAAGIPGGYLLGSRIIRRVKSHFYRSL